MTNQIKYKGVPVDFDGGTDRPEKKLVAFPLDTVFYPEISSKFEVTLLDVCGNDLSVVNAARVSFDKYSEFNKKNELFDKDKKLINYLAKHKHTSPFNHAFLTVRVKAPIFVARQLVKHKFMPWNEVSRRYVDSEPDFYKPKEWRAKADNVKQGSGDEEVKVPDFIFLEVISTCLDAYEKLLSKGVCPEQARMVLPLCTNTEWVWSGTLGAFADMLKLRLDPHTQKESREVAELIYKEVYNLFPVSFKALLGAEGGN